MAEPTGTTTGRPEPGRLRKWLPRIFVTGGLLTLAVLYPEPGETSAEPEPVEVATLELVDLGGEAVPLAAPPSPAASSDLPPLEVALASAAVETDVSPAAGGVVTASVEEFVTGEVRHADGTSEAGSAEVVVPVGHEVATPAWLTGTIEPVVGAE